jgi:hypothetical protein
MRFVRERIDTLHLDALRNAGARAGWLLETSDVIRVGLGRSVDRVFLDDGLEGPFDANDVLSEHSVSGVDGPSGTGVIAFGTLPFDRSAEVRLDVPEFLVTQTSDGETWVTSLEGSSTWRRLLVDVAPPVQETQSMRSLTLQPTPEEKSTPTTSLSRSRYFVPRRSTRWCSPAQSTVRCPNQSTPPP